MNVLGIDGGFASIGLAVLALGRADERLVASWVVRTEKSARKLNVSASSDTARRAREIARAVADAIETHAIGAIAIESPSWPRNAGVAAKMGVGFGAVFALAELHRLPLVMASPQAVKKHLCGRKDASKDEIIARIDDRFDVEWPRAKTLWEHVADAIGVVLACGDSDALQMARRLPGGQLAPREEDHFDGPVPLAAGKNQDAPA